MGREANLQRYMIAKNSLFAQFGFGLVAQTNWHDTYLCSYAEVTYLYHGLVNHLSRYTLFTNANICKSKDMQFNLTRY